MDFIVHKVEKNRNIAHRLSCVCECVCVCVCVRTHTRARACTCALVYACVSILVCLLVCNGIWGSIHAGLHSCVWNVRNDWMLSVLVVFYVFLVLFPKYVFSTSATLLFEAYITSGRKVSQKTVFVAGQEWVGKLKFSSQMWILQPPHGLLITFWQSLQISTLADSSIWGTLDFVQVSLIFQIIPLESR